MKLLFSFLLFALIVQITTAQGKIDGFYNLKGGSTLVLGGGYEDSNGYLAGDNEVDLLREAYYLSIYGAYGITDDLDIIASIPYIESAENKNLQDVNLFVKYRIHSVKNKNGQFEISSALGFSTPLSDYEIGDLNDIGQQATVLETRAMVHYKWNSGWFVTLQSGFSFKFKETPNSLPATLKLGKATTNWYYDAYYDYQHSFGGIDYLGTPSPQNFKRFAVDFHKVGTTLFRAITEEIGAYLTFSYVLDGSNIFLGPAYGVGVSYSF